MILFVLFFSLLWFIQAPFSIISKIFHPIGMSSSPLCHISRTETVLQKCSQEKVFSIYVASLQESIHAELWFQ